MMYLKNLLGEILIWRKVKKIAKANESDLNEKGFRVDWIGRIYTVINLPEEIASHNPDTQQMYILGQFRNFDKIFLEIGIADYIIPEFSLIENSSSYLLVLSPDRDYIRAVPFVWFILKFLFLCLGLRISYLIINHQLENIVLLWNRMINLIF